MSVISIMTCKFLPDYDGCEDADLCVVRVLDISETLDAKETLKSVLSP
jgi:hypothetical protein